MRIIILITVLCVANAYGMGESQKKNPPAYEWNGALVMENYHPQRETQHLLGNIQYRSQASRDSALSHTCREWTEKNKCKVVCCGCCACAICGMAIVYSTCGVAKAAGAVKEIAAWTCFGLQ